MKRLGIIGGTALQAIPGLQNIQEHTFETPYGVPSAPIAIGQLNNIELVFLARHGQQHTIPPHLINYRANLWALKEAAVQQVLAFASVGGMTNLMAPGRFVIPDQLIDYTYGREHTFFADDFTIDNHIDFTQPYNEELRQLILLAAEAENIAMIEAGTYAVTQGPRLETAAEVQRLIKDGCDIVGMTAMPEAALAKELGLSYASCAVVVNWAAGVSTTEITIDDVKAVLDRSDDSIKRLINAISLKM